jgi:2-isopropylmalate synthase
VQAAYLRFLELADRKKHVTSADLEALVSDQLATSEDSLHLVQWKVDIASGEPAMASVVLIHGDEKVVGEGEGNGPVEAIFLAINAAIGRTPLLEYFQIEAVTPNPDAQAQAHVRIRIEDALFNGHGLATDVVEASARAYLAALSRVEQGRPSTVIAGTGVSRWN